MTLPVVERVARALCVADGHDPDALEPGDDPYQGEPGFPSPCIDGYNRKDDACHFMWRSYEFPARAALAASNRDVLVAEIERLRGALTAMVRFGEEVERKNLVGDEGCFWPVEQARAALTPLGGEGLTSAAPSPDPVSPPSTQP